MKHLPDVQASSPEIPLNLTRVGVRNVKKLVELARKGGKRPIVLVSTFDIFVDLPSSMRREQRRERDLRALSFASE